MEYLEGLSKELICSICLSVMEAPVARLPCCHYFCQECITQSVRHRPQCPVCKGRVGRRDISGDETMDRIVTKFDALLAHKDELLAGIALNEETQYFSPPQQQQQQQSLGPGEQLGLSQPAQEAALLPLPPPGEVAMEDRGARAAGAGARGAGDKDNEAVGAQHANQDAAAPAAQKGQECSPLGKRSSEAAAHGQPEGEEGQRPKRAKRGEQAQRPEHTEPQQEGQEQQDGGTAAMELDARPQPLGCLRGVANEHYQSPTASVTSSALDKMLRWRRTRNDDQGPKARRLSMPSAHSSPAKLVQQGGEELLEAPQQAEQGAEESQPPHAAELHNGEEEQQQAQHQQQRQPGGQSAVAPTAGPAAAAQEGRKGRSKAGSRDGGPTTGSQDISKWLAKQAVPRGAEGTAAEAAVLQQGKGKDEGQDVDVTAPKAAPVHGALGDNQAREGQAVSPAVVAAAAPTTSGDGSEGVCTSPGLFSPKGLSPGLVGRRIDSFLEGLEQITPPPAQLAAFSTHKVPAPASTIPPSIAAAAAALGMACRGTGLSATNGPAEAAAEEVAGGAEAAAEEAAEGPEAAAAPASSGRPTVAQGVAPNEAASAGASAAAPSSAGPSEAAAPFHGRGRGQGQPNASKGLPQQGKGRRESAGRLPRSKASSAAAAAAAAAAAGPLDGAPGVGGPAPGSSSSKTPAALAGVAGSCGEGGGSGRRVPSRLVQWACEACTFLNEPQRRKCQMCSTPKPPASRLAQQAQQQLQEEVAPGTNTPAVATDGVSLALGESKASREGGGGSGAKRAWLSLPGSSLGAGPSQRSALACAFCGRDGPSAPEECGELLAFELAGGGEARVHEGCAKWAPNVFEDDAAPHGLANVAAEVSRGRSLHCAGCGKCGAALGCAVKSCRSSYHLPCALEAEGTDFDQGSWALYCPQHAKGRRKRGGRGGRRGSAATAAEHDQEEEGLEEQQQKQKQAGGEAGAEGEEGGPGRSGSKRRRVSGNSTSNAMDAAGVQSSSQAQAKGSVKAGPATAGAAVATALPRRSISPAPACAGTAAGAAAATGGAAEDQCAGAVRAASAGTAPSSAGTAGTALAASWQGPRRGSWVLLGSGLDGKGREQLAQLAAASGAIVARKWGSEVTHVVCGLVNGAARRTYKYLMGILGRKWVVSDAWLEACLRQGAAVEELGFQVGRDTNGSEGGAEASRHSAGLGLPPLLQGYEIFLAGKFSSREEVETLLKSAGAHLLQRMPAAQAPMEGGAAEAPSGPRTSFVLCEAPDAGSPAAQQAGQQRGQEPRRQSAAGSEGAAGQGAAVEALRVEKWFQRATEAGVPVASSKWLMDSVGAYTPRPLAPYLL